MIDGMYILNAERVKETSAEAFILRLYKQKNREGFVRALCDAPEAFSRDFSSVERVMKVLYVTKVH